jgi:hypothetical protein
MQRQLNIEQQQLKQLNIDEMDDSRLLDCYRIALDFGMPAALKAYKKLELESKDAVQNNIFDE